MLETQQLVISNIEEDVLARAVKQQLMVLREVLEAIESRDATMSEVGETLELVEKSLKRIRNNFRRSLTFSH